eukprot:6078339-Alexandrium_andersonii.AAC.1
MAMLISAQSFVSLARSELVSFRMVSISETCLDFMVVVVELAGFFRICICCIWPGDKPEALSWRSL